MTIEQESANFISRFIGEISIGAAIVLMGLLKWLGTRVIDQYITERRLYEILEDHSNKVAKVREIEAQACENRLFQRLIKELKSENIDKS